MCLKATQCRGSAIHVSTGNNLTCSPGLTCNIGSMSCDLYVESENEHSNFHCYVWMWVLKRTFTLWLEMATWTKDSVDKALQHVSLELSRLHLEILFWKSP